MPKRDQAQIEAVIKAIADIDHYDGEGHGLCMTGYEEIARAVLTAAAQVVMLTLDERNAELVERLKTDKAATIERCAQIAEAEAEAFEGDMYVVLWRVVKAIRKLKDEADAET